MKHVAVYLKTINKGAVRDFLVLIADFATAFDEGEVEICVSTMEEEK